MSCFSINYTRYCLTIKFSIISIRFRDVFKLFAIVELLQKRNFNSLFLSVWKVLNLVHTFSLFFFSFGSSFLSSFLLSSLPLILSSPILSSPLYFAAFLFSSLPLYSLLFSSFYCFPLLFSSFYSFPILFSPPIFFFAPINSSTGPFLSRCVASFLPLLIFEHHTYYFLIFTLFSYDKYSILNK